MLDTKNVRYIIVCRLSFVVCRLSFVVCRLSFVVCRLSLVAPRLRPSRAPLCTTPEAVTSQPSSAQLKSRLTKFSATQPIFSRKSRHWAHLHRISCVCIARSLSGVEMTGGNNGATCGCYFRLLRLRGSPLD